MPLPLIHAYSQALWGKKNPPTHTKDNHFVHKKGQEKASHEAYEE